MPEAQKRRPSYEFQKPPEGYSVSIDWVFGGDSFTKNLSQKLHFAVSDRDIEKVSHIASRDPTNLGAITDIWGRSAHSKSDQADIILGHSYSTLDLGGFGIQKFIVSNDAVVNIDFIAPIGLPNAHNFASQYPSVTRTNVFDGHKELTLGDPFSFTGAYTAKQIAHKCASNVFFLNKLSNMDEPPFIVPIPLAIGHYPTIINENGEYAYFGIFKVPYEGKRTGNRHIVGGDTVAIMEYAQDLIESVPAIAPALAYISNSFGLTHNQPHPGNIYIPKAGEGKLPLLADFSTVYPLNSRGQELARARELSRGIDSVWKILQTLFQHPSEDKIIGNVLQKTLEKYIGYDLPSIVPTKACLVEPFLVQLFEQIGRNGIIPKVTSSEESWQKIVSLEKIFMKEIKKNLLA